MFIGLQCSQILARTFLWLHVRFYDETKDFYIIFQALNSASMLDLVSFDDFLLSDLHENSHEVLMGQLILGKEKMNVAKKNS